LYRWSNNCLSAPADAKQVIIFINL